MEALSCKKGGEGLHKGSDHQSTNQSKNNKWKATGAEQQNVGDDNPITPGRTISELDSVMVDVTVQENKTNDFEAQLREIDCAI